MTKLDDNAAEIRGVGERARGRLAPGNWPQWVGPLIGLAALVGVVSVAEHKFLSPENLLNVLQDVSISGVVALGMTFVIIIGGIDLSVGSLAALAGGLGIWMMNTAIHASSILAGQSQSAVNLVAPYGAVRTALAGAFQWLRLGNSEPCGIAVAFAVILLAGVAAGAFNGLLITRGRIAPFIATLGGLAAYRSLALALADGGEFRSAAAGFKTLGAGGIELPVLNQYGHPLLLPWPVLVFAGLAAACWLVLAHTRYGRHVYAIGCSERAAAYSAVRVDRVRLVTYTMMGLLVGIAGAMNSSRMNSVSSGMSGGMWELDAIAAVVIGGTRMTGGAGGILGTVIGLLILGCISNMLVLLQVSVHLQGLVKGLIILAAVLIQRGRKAA